MANPRGRNWCFTLNNPEQDELFHLDGLTARGEARFLIYQIERGDSGTEHAQGYVEFLCVHRLGAVKNLIGRRCHVEVRRGSRAQAIDYCRKEDTRVKGPFEFGSAPQPGKRSDLDDAYGLIMEGEGFYDIAQALPSTCIRYARGIRELLAERDREERTKSLRLNLKCWILWGEPGSGKTRAVYDHFGLGSVYTLTTSASGGTWFDGYRGESVLLIDDFKGFIPFHFFLKMLDIYPLRLDVKGSFTYANWTTVVITSNHPIDEWYSYTEKNLCLPALRRRFYRVIHYGVSSPSAFSSNETSVFSEDVETQEIPSS